MKKRLPRKRFPADNRQQARTAGTGDHCPLNGWWLPADIQLEKLFIAEGSIMPPYEGSPVLWTMVGIDVPQMSQGGPPLVREHVL
jgi:hypothetical protein